MKQRIALKNIGLSIFALLMAFTSPNALSTTQPPMDEHQIVSFYVTNYSQLPYSVDINSPGWVNVTTVTLPSNANLAPGTRTQFTKIVNYKLNSLSFRVCTLVTERGHCDINNTTIAIPGNMPLGKEYILYPCGWPNYCVRIKYY